MPSAVSCGVLLLNEEAELFLGHATGKRHWDIPKGKAEEEESRLETALRETREETGLDLSAYVLLDLGEYPYLSQKKLHLFATQVRKADIDLCTCRCTTFFDDPRTGKSRPEIDDFRWVKLFELQDYCCKSLYQLFAARLSLYELHERLS